MFSWEVQFSSGTQSYPTLCNLMDCSTPGFPVHHQLPKLTQTHVHWVGDTIQPSHPLLSPSPPAFSLSQHQGLFKWVSFSHQVGKVLEFQLQHQSFQWMGSCPQLNSKVTLTYLLFTQSLVWKLSYSPVLAKRMWGELCGLWRKLCLSQLGQHPQVMSLFFLWKWSCLGRGQDLLQHLSTCRGLPRWCWW